MSEEIKDGLIECPRCKSHVCYGQKIGSEETWLCLTCGFSSTTLMKSGTETEKNVSNKQPKLYQDLRFTDSDGYVWYPSCMTVPEIGMVYIDGTNLEDWEWVATPMRKLSPKEQRMKQYRGQKYVANVKETKRFGKDGFMKAAISIGMFGGENED